MYENSKLFLPLLINMPSFLISPTTPSLATASEPARSTSRIREFRVSPLKNKIRAVLETKIFTKHRELYPTFF